MQHSMCVVRKMIAVGCSGTGVRWEVGQQLTEVCRQGWLNVRTLYGRTGNVFFNERRREENGRTVGQDKAWVEHILESAEGGAGMLHSITKPRSWRGGAQFIGDVFEDAQLSTTVKVKGQEWKEHWQVETPEQVMSDKPWEHGE